MSDRTTIEVYTADRDWLQQRQRVISAERDKWVPMPQLMREFVKALQEAEEGN